MYLPIKLDIQVQTASLKPLKYNKLPYLLFIIWRRVWEWNNTMQ